MKMVKVFVRAAGRDNCGGCVYRGDGILLLISGGLVASRPCSLVRCRGARGLQGSAWLVLLRVACTHARVHQGGVGIIFFSRQFVVYRTFIHFYRTPSLIYDDLSFISKIGQSGYNIGLGFFVPGT